MELFPAADEEQFAYIKKLIDESDYYVVIIAGRYGSLAEDGLSYTEKEFDYAIEKKVPVLAFLHEHPGRIPSELTDPENAGRLTAFRKKIESSKRLVKYWTTADNLRADVQAALSYAFESRPRTGWVRDNSSQDTSQLKEQLDQANRLIKDKQKEIDTYQRECEKSISTLQTQLDESREKEDRLRHQLARFERMKDTPPTLTKYLVKTETCTMGRWNDKPLEWIVLEVLPGRALLITKDCLLKAPYNTEQVSVTWEKCSLRNEVLPQILEQVFDDKKERDRVLLCKNQNYHNPSFGTPGGADTDDKLFMLSINEVKQYFPTSEDRVAHLKRKAVWWWLRSPGDGSNRAAVVGQSGGAGFSGDVSWSAGGVRPAFWLNLKS